VVQNVWSREYSTLLWLVERVSEWSRGRKHCSIATTPVSAAAFAFRQMEPTPLLQEALADCGTTISEDVDMECQLGVWGCTPRTCVGEALRLSALMHLYIHPLYVLVSKIISSILNSPALIHPLYHPLSTLSTVGPTYHFI
jgi:hypothetical protein